MDLEEAAEKTRRYLLPFSPIDQSYTPDRSRVRELDASSVYMHATKSGTPGRAPVVIVHPSLARSKKTLLLFPSFIRPFIDSLFFFIDE